MQHVEGPPKLRKPAIGGAARGSAARRVRTRQWGPDQHQDRSDDGWIQGRTRAGETSGAFNCMRAPRDRAVPFLPVFRGRGAIHRKVGLSRGSFAMASQPAAVARVCVSPSSWTLSGGKARSSSFSTPELTLQSQYTGRGMDAAMRTIRPAGTDMWTTWANWTRATPFGAYHNTTYLVTTYYDTTYLVTPQSNCSHVIEQYCQYGKPCGPRTAPPYCQSDTLTQSDTLCVGTGLTARFLDEHHCDCGNHTAFCAPSCTAIPGDVAGVVAEERYQGDLPTNGQCDGSNGWYRDRCACEGNWDPTDKCNTCAADWGGPNCDERIDPDIEQDLYLQYASGWGDMWGDNQRVRKQMLPLARARALQKAHALISKYVPSYLASRSNETDLQKRRAFGVQLQQDISEYAVRFGQIICNLVDPHDPNTGRYVGNACCGSWSSDGCEAQRSRSKKIVAYQDRTNAVLGKYGLWWAPSPPPRPPPSPSPSPPSPPSPPPVWYSPQSPAFGAVVLLLMISNLCAILILLVYCSRKGRSAQPGWTPVGTNLAISESVEMARPPLVVTGTAVEETIITGTPATCKEADGARASGGNKLLGYPYGPEP